MAGSPKTTAAAIALLVATIAQIAWFMLDGDPATNPDWSVSMAGILAAVGFFFARDNDKSSEDVGIK